MDHWNVGLGGGQTYDAAGMAHEDGSARVGNVRIKLLESHYVGLEAFDDLGHTAVDFNQAISERLLRRSADDAGLDDARLLRSLGVALEDTVARDIEAGVDAENAERNCRLKIADCRLQIGRSCGGRFHTSHCVTSDAIPCRPVGPRA